MDIEEELQTQSLGTWYQEGFSTSFSTWFYFLNISRIYPNLIYALLCGEAKLLKSIA